jgi:hypothetical protein
LTLDSKTLTKIQELEKYVQPVESANKTIQFKLYDGHDLKFNLDHSDTKLLSRVNKKGVRYSSDVFQFVVTNLNDRRNFEQKLHVSRSIGREIFNKFKEYETTELSITRISEGKQGRKLTYSIREIDYAAPVIMTNGLVEKDGRLV